MGMEDGKDHYEQPKVVQEWGCQALQMILFRHSEGLLQEVSVGLDEGSHKLKIDLHSKEQ